jgi:hypothetical protein
MQASILSIAQARYMNASNIITIGDFHKYLLWLAKNPMLDYQGSLEKYLCALFPLLQQHRHSSASWSLFGSLFLEALTRTPISFDNSWSAYDSPPDTILKRQQPQGDGFEDAQAMILYQIADLHRMEQAGYFADEQLMLSMWMGMPASPAGYRWSNLYPVGFLEQMAYGIHEDSTVTECSWTDFGTILWLGQIIE